MTTSSATSAERRLGTSGRLVALVAAVMLLAAAACGSGSESNAPTAGESATSTDTSSPLAEATTGLFDDKRVAVLGSNPWPIVGDLLTVGVVPVAVLGQEGRDGIPDYLAEAHPEAAEIPFVQQNLGSPNLEELGRLDVDLWVMPEFIEPLLLENEQEWRRPEAL